MTINDDKFSLKAHKKPMNISTGHQQGIISRVYSINKGLSRKKIFITFSVIVENVLSIGSWYHQGK